MLGAFAGPTMQPGVDGLRGDCIMAYRGDFIPRTGDAPYRGRRGAYAMETEDFFIVPPAGSLPGELVDVFEYPASAVNEPPAGVDANCVFLRWFRIGDILSGPKADRGEVDLITLHAARDLLPGEELFASYGIGYSHRTWPACATAQLNKSAAQKPCNGLRYVSADSWRMVRTV